MIRREDEDAIRALCQGARYNEAVERVLAAYGQEMKILISRLVRDPDLAEDASAMFHEHLLKGLPRFEWRCSLRTWLGRVAQNAAFKTLESQRREEPLEDEGLVPAPEERSRTQPWCRTDVKDAFRALREKLDPRDQILLQLRVDQRLSWEQVAEMMASPDEEEPSSEALKRSACSLRQRFKRLREQLTELARQSGLVSEQDSHPPSA